MFKFDDIIERLQGVLEKERGHRVFEKEIATELGMTPAHFSNAKKRNSIPYEKLSEYCIRQRININWILCGQSSHLLDAEKEDYYRIKLINNVNSSAGGGAINDENENITYLMIDPMFVDTLGIRGKKKIEAVKVVGDSMEPTISDGALIVVDREKTELVNGMIYVLNSPNGVVVKRVSVNLNGLIELISDNSVYPVQSVSGEDLSVIGRVVGILEKI